MSSVGRPSICTSPPRCHVKGHRRGPRDLPRNAVGLGQGTRHGIDDRPDRPSRDAVRAAGDTGREGHPAGGRGCPAAGGEGQDRDREGDPSSGGQVFRWGDELVSRFQFVADHRDTFEVKRLCEVIEVNRSSFYAWDAAAESRAERAAADEELAGRIRAVHEVDKAYGAPRITAELNDGAPPAQRVNHKRVARVMAEHGIAGIRLRRRVRTTVPEPSDAKAPDLLKRDFTAEQPNTKYVGDITYLPLADGTNLYLATVIDCCSRKLVGWALADHIRTALVEDALKAALGARGSLRGAIFHADHGTQYTSKDYAKLCTNLGVTLSLGGVGSSADNALAEAFNATLKRETLAGSAAFADEATCRREIFRWATRYNTRRRHSYREHLSPNTYENQLAAILPEAA